MKRNNMSEEKVINLMVDMLTFVVIFPQVQEALNEASDPSYLSADSIAHLATMTDAEKISFQIFKSEREAMRKIVIRKTLRVIISM
jgi:hypothetical protein